MHHAVRVGTSGWSYDDWDGTFYPGDVPRSRWAAHYRSVFSTVEINYTFYRLPRSTSVTRWHDEAPRGFRYATKGSRLITHMRRIQPRDREVRTYLDRVRPLKSYLAVVLWQLPPDLKRDVARLDNFLGRLPRRLDGSPLRHAVEFRDHSWLDDDVFDLLARRRASCVWISSAAMPPVRPHTADPVYVRFHGLTGGWRHDYTDRELEPWAAALAEVDTDAYAFFNNDGRANAPRNARTLTAMLGPAAYPWPRP